MSQKLGQAPKTIEITVAPDGTPTVEAVGFAGKGCLAATKPYEDALGVAGDRTLKPEMRLAPAAARATPDVKTDL